MPDQLYLSLWIRGFDESTALDRFGELLRAFPFSNLRPGLSAIRIYAMEFAEPALFEQLLPAEATVDDVIDLAAEFENPDCAYVVEGWWELWQFSGGAWELKPARVVLTCFGPEFENEVGDHLRLELGSESDFLPQSEVPESPRKIQSNLQGVLRLAEELREAVPVERRKLWSDSGENFAERLGDAVIDELL